MKTKLFVEPKGKAREEVILYSCIPADWESYQKWKNVWLSSKEFKKWNKSAWPSETLGEIRPGKIINITMDELSLKGPLTAYRSFYPDDSGNKIKLPMVLFARVKKNFELNHFKEELQLTDEKSKELKEDLKEDALAPMAVWHPQPVDRNQEIRPADVLDHAINYAKALFTVNPKSVGWSAFFETEMFTT